MSSSTDTIGTSNQEGRVRLQPSIYQLCFLAFVSIAVLAALIDLLAFEKALLLTLWYIALAISGAGDG